MNRNDWVDHKVSMFVSRTHSEQIYLNDPQFHAEITQLSRLLKMADMAMAAEGVETDTRNSVVDRVLFGGGSSVEQMKRAAASMRVGLSDGIRDYDGPAHLGNSQGLT